MQIFQKYDISPKQWFTRAMRGLREIFNPTAGNQPTTDESATPAAPRNTKPRKVNMGEASLYKLSLEIKEKLRYGVLPRPRSTTHNMTPFGVSIEYVIDDPASGVYIRAHCRDYKFAGGPDVASQYELEIRNPNGALRNAVSDFALAESGPGYAAMIYQRLRSAYGD